MFSTGLTYFPGDTAVHRCDARAKLVLLLAFSIAAALMRSWPALLACCAAVLLLALAARIPLRRINRMLLPVYVMAAFSLLFNWIAHPALEGLSTGLFFALRMVMLVAASFVVCLTTTVKELLDSFTWFIAPLRHVRVPVDDVSFTLALSIRFIPVIEEEFARIRLAQISRCSDAQTSLKRRLQIWAAAFASLFVGLFRHADTLATAMDARCYGASENRTSLFTPGD